MNDRLYYEDAYCRIFNAKVIERLNGENGPGIILDHTYFYPTSGGQPHDLGLINQIQVVDVHFRAHDDKIVHVLAEEMNSDVVEAEIEWARRFDHMQQHTGQHILSQAFVQVAGKHTLSFHLGSESCTIDLAANGLTAENIDEVENLANQIVWENRPILIRLINGESDESLELRKVPELNGDQLRVVEIEGFDNCACGGTHVSCTGEIGIIKIVKTERRGEDLRIEFLCGNRALADYHKKNAILNRLSNELTTGYWEVEHAVDRIRGDAKSARNQLKRQTKRITSLEANVLFQEAIQIDSANIIDAVFKERDPAEIRLLANQIIRRPRSIALLGSAGQKAQLVFAASKDVPVGMGEILAQVLPLLGEATGGGSPTFAQGGGPATNEETIRKALNEARGKVIQSLNHEASTNHSG